jgi:hypothetical protein
MVLAAIHEGEDHLKDLDVYGTIIIKRILKKWEGGMYRIDQAQDRASLFTPERLL